MRKIQSFVCALLMMLMALCSSHSLAQEPATGKRLALTFDDLPRARGAFLDDTERSRQLVDALRRTGVDQVAFFVNPGTIPDHRTAEIEARIRAYVDAGHVIANHSATHPRLQAVTVDAFLADVDAAEDWLRGRAGYRPWFRFPYLDEGGPDTSKRSAVRSALQERGLLNATVTINASDWWIEQAAVDARTSGRTLDLAKLGDFYVDTHLRAANFYEDLGQRLTGRSIAHVLLLHETDLAALFIEDLVAALRADGWTIISADEAFRDAIYAEEPVTPFAQGTLLEQLAWQRDLPEPRWFPGNNIEQLSQRFAEAMDPGEDPGSTSSLVEEDPFVWLEQARSARALRWVEQENSRTEAEYFSSELYRKLERETAVVIGTPDRIPRVGWHPDGVYNFWQDKSHPRGILRRAPENTFLKGAPAWENVLDVDALAEREGRNWVYKGLNCLPPELRLCMVSLSDGGADAALMREFDTVEKRFVENGFTLDPGMNFVAWIAEDTLAVARDWGADSLSESGFPLITKMWQRGSRLTDAEEVFRGEPADNLAWAYPLRDQTGRYRGLIAQRQINFHERSYALLHENRWVDLDWPMRAAPYGVWVSDNHLILALHQTWQRGEVSYPNDALLAYDLDEFLADPRGAQPQLIWQPGDRETRTWVATTSDALYLLTLKNVRSRALRLDFVNGYWETQALDLPGDATATIHTASPAGDRILLNLEGFLTPPSLALFDGQANSIAAVREASPVFDARGMRVEQFEALSEDGTAIPYFLVTGAGKNSGPRPLLLTGYGGFQGSQLPYYLGIEGRLWLARGGAFVVANLRGGGEFGPAWHQVAIRENKQRTWDDFIAVAEDLVARSVTTSEQLGIIGGSQGGLLVGAALTQRPGLFNAAVIQMPLFDMLRYHLIGQGASWMAEYGDPRRSEDRQWLAAYSPYHHLDTKEEMPPPLIITSTADDRTHPAHGRKAAARLKALGRDYFYFEADDGGHSSGVNPKQQGQLKALAFAYLIERLMPSAE